MIGVPKVRLQLHRNIEINRCLELLTTECDAAVVVLTIMGERLQFARNTGELPVHMSDVFMPFLSRTYPELYMLYNIQHPVENVKFYAGLPLITTDGNFLGSICVMDTKPRSLSVGQQELLAQTASHILEVL